MFLRDTNCHGLLVASFGEINNFIVAFMPSVVRVKHLAETIIRYNLFPPTLFLLHAFNGPCNVVNRPSSHTIATVIATRRLKETFFLLSHLKEDHFAFNLSVDALK